MLKLKIARDIREYYIMLYDTIQEQKITEIILYRPSSAFRNRSLEGGVEDYLYRLIELVTIENKSIVRKQHIHNDHSQSGGKIITKKTTIKKDTNPTKKYVKKSVKNKK